MISVIIVAEFPDDPGRFYLIRKETPQNRVWIWCGRDLGWLPNTTGYVHRAPFATVDAALLAADEYVGWPVNA